MKRALVLSCVLVFAVGISARAAVILSDGDVIQYIDQAPNESQGSGGAFDWKIVSATGVSSSVGTTFQTFCTSLTLQISSSDSVVAPPNSNLSIGSVLNTSGNTLQNMKGLYLFDLWSKGLLNPYLSSDGSASVAGAVQVEIWLSEGYGTSSVPNGSGGTEAGIGGIKGSELTYDLSLLSTLLGVSDSGVSYSSSWTPTDIAAVDLDAYPSGQPAQDQIVLIPTSGTSSSGSPSTPEPTSMIVWGIGAGVAGAAAVRRRGQRRTRWTKQNRQAILAVIDRGRNQQQRF